ncbi:undecaprenyl-diphosphate phosphatase [Halovulum dunhuangense]|uniref:Undecaprenyl-diphosphatase n=1 Tax=Halovulum dunhuangense TaxID=1505036 RepID=A0A849KVG6_9RHOB|nr:undecaprenyl-diphosphate phosphatase [Halovulum dunhuangense]NNU79388.1 undecaprenyl-diphosphate phosphatase [Halovulum dunhuangense]
MPYSLIAMLALIQGLTEFLPVSSSAHLVLVHDYMGGSADELKLDIAVHLGTLAAVVLYFRAEMGQALTGLGQILRGRLATYEAHLALCLIVATIPVGLAGIVLHLTGLVEMLRSVAVIGWAMIVFGILLWWLDRRGGSGKSAREWTMKDALRMGLWQALALIPGTSRSGAAISGGLACGYERGAAARIAMLMSVPTIAMTGVLLLGELARSGDLALGREVALAAGLSFVAGLAALALMMRLLKSVSYTPYVVYRVALGVVLLAVAYG